MCSAAWYAVKFEAASDSFNPSSSGLRLPLGVSAGRLYTLAAGFVLFILIRRPSRLLFYTTNIIFTDGAGTLQIFSRNIHCGHV